MTPAPVPPMIPGIPDAVLVALVAVVGVLVGAVVALVGICSADQSGRRSVRGTDGPAGIATEAVARDLESVASQFGSASLYEKAGWAQQLSIRERVHERSSYSSLESVLAIPRCCSMRSTRRSNS